MPSLGSDSAFEMDADSVESPSRNAGLLGTERLQWRKGHECKIDNRSNMLGRAMLQASCNKGVGACLTDFS